MRYAVLLLLFVGCTRAQPVAQPTPLPVWTYATPAPWDQTHRDATLNLGGSAWWESCVSVEIDGQVTGDTCDACSACVRRERGTDMLCVPCNFDGYPRSSGTAKCQALTDDERAACFPSRASRG